MPTPLVLLYPDWPQHAGSLRDRVRDLTPDQLALRAGPNHGLNRLFTHDAFHAGEISQLLGRDGLPAIDLWARTTT